jgi:hypothetical protein
MAFRNSFAYTIAKRILDTSYGNERQITGKVVVRNLKINIVLAIQGTHIKNDTYFILCRCNYRWGWPRIKVSVTKRNSPKGLVSVEYDGPGNVVTGKLINWNSEGTLDKGRSHSKTRNRG